MYIPDKVKIVWHKNAPVRTGNTIAYQEDTYEVTSLDPGHEGEKMEATRVKLHFTNFGLDHAKVHYFILDQDYGWHRSGTHIKHTYGIKNFALDIRLNLETPEELPF